MIKRIYDYIKEQNLFTLEDKILVGLSGGRDSISMLYLLHSLGIKIAIAHCNFQLRGEDSDKDEIFVKRIAEKLKIPFYHIRFDTLVWAKEHKESTQMAARTLRYNWFEKVRKENNYNYIAIAHNSDDLVETFFINLIRGTGIDGLRGIKPKNGNIVRPLLFASREDINKYITKNKYIYREDKSNNSTHYMRNKIRHLIIPEFEKISSSFKEIMLQDMLHLQQVSEIYHFHIKEQKKQILLPLNNRYEIDIQKLQDLPIPFTYLYEFIKEFNFNASLVQEIIDSLEKESGKKFYSTTHQLIKDRNKLIITKLNEEENEPVFFDENIVEIKEPISFTLKVQSRASYKISRNPNVAALDYDKLKFPLQLRKWKSGDFFMPLGMNRMKKLSDFFIDNKWSLVDKQNAFLIQSGNDIVCVLGHRIDERYKITEDTTKLFIIEKTTNANEIINKFNNVIK